MTLIRDTQRQKSRHLYFYRRRSVLPNPTPNFLIDVLVSNLGRPCTHVTKDTSSQRKTTRKVLPNSGVGECFSLLVSSLESEEVVGLYLELVNNRLPRAVCLPDEVSSAKRYETSVSGSRVSQILHRLSKF